MYAHLAHVRLTLLTVITLLTLTAAPASGRSRTGGPRRPRPPAGATTAADLRRGVGRTPRDQSGNNQTRITTSITQFSTETTRQIAN